MQKELIVPRELAQTETVNARGLGLPRFLDGQIGFDVAGISALARMGNMLKITIESAPPPDRSRDFYFKPQLVTREVKPIMNGNKPTGWNELTLQVDVQAVADEIINRYSKLRWASLWASVLNTHIRETIIKQGIINAVKPSRDASTYLADLAGSALLYTTAATAVGGNLDSAFRGALMLAMLQAKKVVVSPDVPRTSDIFYATHPVRALTTAFQAHRLHRNLVVALP